MTVPEQASRAQVWTLLAISAVWGISYAVITPFFNQLLLETGAVVDPADAGFYQGLAQSAVSTLRLLTIFPVTLFCNLYGRKPTLLLMLICLVVSAAPFGLSTNYSMMIIFRLFGGVAGAMHPATRVMGLEMARTMEEESWIISFLAISSRVGQVIGQLIGGLLSHPERRWPSSFENNFWSKYPYALPCFVSAACATVVAIIAGIFLKETLPLKQPKAEECAAELGEITPLLSSCTSTTDTMQSNSTSLTSLKAIMEPICLNPGLISVLVSITAMSLVWDHFSSVYPLFSFTPIELGGLGLSEVQIGFHMSAYLFMTAFSLVAYTPLQKKLGTLGVYHLAVFCWIPIMFLSPILSWIAKGRLGGEGGIFWYLTLFVLFTLWAITGMAWPSAFIMPTYYLNIPQSKATIQAIICACYTISEIISPALGNSLFAVSARSQNILSEYSFWVAMFTMSVVVFLYSLTLPEMESRIRKSR